MRVPSSRRDQSSSHTCFCIRYPDKIREPPEFQFRILEKVMVVRNESLFSICFFKHPPVIDFPEPQTKRIGSSISFLHRMSNFERVSYDDDRFEPGQHLPPERQGQAIARILPAPYARRTEF